MVDLVCVNGEIEVADIIAAINELNLLVEANVACCEANSVGDIIRTRRDGNVLYMTNDGSNP